MYRFPAEAYGRRNYTKIIITLDSSPKVVPVHGDYLAVVASETTADISKVYVGINTTEADLPLVEVVPAFTPFSYLTLRWEASETGKKVALLVGGEAVFSQYREYIVIVGDLANIAKEPTLQLLTSALASKATDKLRAQIVDPLPRSPFTLYDSTNAELSDYIKNLDITLSALARLIKFNRNVSPTWVYGSEITAPAAGTALVSRTVSTGRVGYVYGIFISAGEPNDFRLQWVSATSTRSIRIPFSSKGAIMVVFDVPVNEGLPADAGSAIRLVNLNAGSSGVVYQAGILYAEVSGV
jgi:hypothetical protein